MSARKNKFKAQKVKADGHTFDSKAEHRRYEQLKLLVRIGEIAGLVVHPKYTLHAPAIGGGESKVGTYSADFSYTVVGSGDRVVEDVKSTITQKQPMYRWKKRHMAIEYGIDVHEVTA